MNTPQEDRPNRLASSSDDGSGPDSAEYVLMVAMMAIVMVNVLILVGSDLRAVIDGALHMVAGVAGIG